MNENLIVGLYFKRAGEGAEPGLFFIQKPFALLAMLKKVREVLDMRSAE